MQLFSSTKQAYITMGSIQHPKDFWAEVAQCKAAVPTFLNNDRIPLNAKGHTMQSWMENGGGRIQLCLSFFTITASNAFYPVGSDWLMHSRVWEKEKTKSLSPPEQVSNEIKKDLSQRGPLAAARENRILNCTPFPYIVHYFWAEPYGPCPLSKVVHHIQYSMLFRTQPECGEYKQGRQERRSKNTLPRLIKTREGRWECRAEHE